jgi:hypothetical protein
MAGWRWGKNLASAFSPGKEEFPGFFNNRTRDIRHEKWGKGCILAEEMSYFLGGNPKGLPDCP